MIRLIEEIYRYLYAKVFILLIVSTYGVLCISSVSFGYERQLTIARGDGNYFPYEMTERGSLSGIHIESIKAVAESLNWKVTFKSLPWEKAVSSLQRGEIDALTYLNKSEEREKFSIFLDDNILSYVEYVFFTKAGFERNIAFSGDMHQLKGHEITTNRGYYYGEKFEQATYLKKIEAISLAQQVHFVLRGKYKLGVANKVDLHFILKRMKATENISVLDPSISKVPTYIAFAKLDGHKLLAKEFARAFAAFKKSDGYQGIIAKYGLTEPLSAKYGS